MRGQGESHLLNARGYVYVITRCLRVEIKTQRECVSILLNILSLFLWFDWTLAFRLGSGCRRKKKKKISNRYRGPCGFVNVLKSNLKNRSGMTYQDVGCGKRAHVLESRGVKK